MVVGLLRFRVNSQELLQTVAISRGDFEDPIVSYDTKRFACAVDEKQCTGGSREGALRFQHDVTRRYSWTTHSILGCMSPWFLTQLYRARLQMREQLASG